MIVTMLVGLLVRMHTKIRVLSRSVQRPYSLWTSVEVVVKTFIYCWMCKWIPRIASSGTNPLFLFNSKLRRGDPFTDSTLCGGTFFREPCKSKLISFKEIFLIFCHLFDVLLAFYCYQILNLPNQSTITFFLERKEREVKKAVFFASLRM